MEFGVRTVAKNAGDLPSESWCMLGRRSRTITVVDEQPQGMDMTRPVHCLRQGNVWGNPTYWHYPPLTIFFTSVLHCRADGKSRGNSALWDEHGRLIVRADRVHYC